MTGTMLSMVCVKSLSWFSKNKWMRTHILDNFETIRIVSMEDIGSHEREDGHNVVKDRVWSEPGQVGHQEQSLIERLRVVGNCHANLEVDERARHNSTNP